MLGLSSPLRRILRQNPRFKRLMSTPRGDQPWLRAGYQPPKMPIHKYQKFTDWYDRKLGGFKRTWPDNTLGESPTWVSVDLRDGNQALINPMDHDKKLRMYLYLLKMGFKDIEVGFPSASQTDFDFVRFIIDNKLIPDDVWIQVLIQSREDLISRTIDAVEGAPNVVLHLYNATSVLQRRVVFKESVAGVKKIATDGLTFMKDLVDKRLTASNVRLEYSPESFTGTELDVAMEVCEAALDTWGATAEKPAIINLPATVEMSTPNVYADQIQWMGQNFTDRSRVILSLHPHNDRGCAIAAAELGVLAGADRVEGCLFGCGERTGNVDIVALAMNMFSQGIDPKLDLSDMKSIIEVSEYCTELPVPARMPWSGSLAYTAFSGSHQDAIKKGMAEVTPGGKWEVPYLPIDPTDLGCNYDAVIRVNSQSGKGGCMWVIERELGITLPKPVQADVSKVVQKETDRTSKEIMPDELCQLFKHTYLVDGAITLKSLEFSPANGEPCALKAGVSIQGKQTELSG